MDRVAAVLLLSAAIASGGSQKMAVVGSKHDLTPTGSGGVKSAATDACIFCHAPHNVQPNVTPLWDHKLSVQTYVTYTSSTYTSGSETPAAGTSKLCLSCHDGSVASGLTVAQGMIATTGAMSSVNNLTANLTASHPVSMAPVDDGSLVSTLFTAPASTRDPAVKLVSGKVECTTCHDPHVPTNDPAQGMFLVRSNANGALCLACHDPSRIQPNFLGGWTTSAHATGSYTVPTTGNFGKYGTVAADACSNCHMGHNNAAGARNLRGAEESACSQCHSGANVSPALPNVMNEFTKIYAHPTMTVSGAHDPKETIPVNTTRHAECADCHNPHATYAQSGTALPPSIPSPMAGVNGYDTSGVQTVASLEYQVCFKCHADSTNKPATSTYGRTAVRYPAGAMPATYPIQPPKPADQYNLRLKFSGVIGHNVMGFSTATTSNTTLLPYMLNVDGTSNLNRPLSAVSRLYCEDCHNNDQARNFKGTGPNGPHASSFPHLLQFNLYQEPLGGGGRLPTGGAALCAKCHNLTSVGNVRPHGDHSDVACTTCHDPHGVIGGTPSANRAMMNFDTGIVSAAGTYLGYFYMGTTRGSRGCYLTCHGERHNPYTY